MWRTVKLRLNSLRLFPCGLCKKVGDGDRKRYFVLVLCVMDVENCSITCLNSQRLFPCGLRKDFGAKRVDCDINVQ